MSLRPGAWPAPASSGVAHSPVRSHISVARGARARIGLGVTIGAGFSLSCRGEVTIGDRVCIGPFVQILDCDLHTPGDHGNVPDPRPVRIGPGAVIGAWSTLLPGSDVGAGAVVEPYSVVTGPLPPGLRAAGNPAVSLGPPAAQEPGGNALTLVRRAIKDTFGLPCPLHPGDNRETIDAWTSLGALRLLARLEHACGAELPEADVLAARSVEELAGIIDRARMA